jgi:hypothetical protein
MASASTFAALFKMFRTVYFNRDLVNQAKRKTPAFDSVQKMDDFDGEALVFPFNDSLAVGIGDSVSSAKNNATSSGFDKWTLTTLKKMYGILTIDSEAILRARKNIGAFLRTRQKEVNDLMAYMKMVLGGHAFWGDGAGNLSQVVAVTGANPVTSFTVPRNDGVKFHRRQILVFNATRTGAPGGIKASTWRVDKVARNTAANTATITVTRVTGAGAGVDPAALDYVYQNNTYDKFPIGVDGYIPKFDPGSAAAIAAGIPTTLHGMDRSLDVEMRSGFRVTWQGSIEETIKLLCAVMGQYVDQENSVCWVSHYNWFRLEQELTAQGRKVIDARATQVFGSPALLILTPDGNIPVVRDPYLDNDRGYVLDMSQFEVHHLGPVLGMTDEDGLTALRQTDDDGIEIRIRFMGENLIQRPFMCGRFEIVGN